MNRNLSDDQFPLEFREEPGEKSRFRALVAYQGDQPLGALQYDPESRIIEDIRVEKRGQGIASRTYQEMGRRTEGYKDWSRSPMTPEGEEWAQKFEPDEEGIPRPEELPLHESYRRAGY